MTYLFYAVVHSLISCIYYILVVSNTIMMLGIPPGSAITPRFRFTSTAKGPANGQPF